jgi:hypothetical protein
MGLFSRRNIAPLFYALFFAAIDGLWLRAEACISSER